MTHILSTRLLAHYRLLVVQADAATADVPTTLARPSLSFAATVAAIVLVAIDLRPGIVSIGPLLPYIRQEFGMSKAEASLLTAIPAMLMGELGLQTAVRPHELGQIDFEFLDEILMSELEIVEQRRARV